MAGYSTSVRPYFHELQASENTAQECNIQPYYLLNHQIIDLLYTTLILVASRKQTATAHARFKGRCCVQFNELQAFGLFLAFDGANMRTDPFATGKKYHKLLNNAVFIRNESLFFVSAM